MRALGTLVLVPALLAGCASAPAKTAPQAAKTQQTSDDYVPVETFAAKHKALTKPVLNNKPPKGFKRYNAPGVVPVTAKLLYPRRDIIGIFREEPRFATPLAAARDFGKLIGKQPTMVKKFATWGQPYDGDWANTMWKNGILPQYELESWPNNGGPTLAAIAGGSQDAAIRQLARQIRASKVPVSFSFAHEMNGDWYPWGHCPVFKPTYGACHVKATPWQFRTAWKRMWNIFQAEKATNAIWLWQPNSTISRPNVRLKQFWPGSKFVDWVGVVEYYKRSDVTFQKLFIPTFVEIRKFTKKPILLPEAGTIKTTLRPKQVTDFLRGVAAYPNVIGFIWFNQDKSKAENKGDYRLEATPKAVTTFRAGLKKGYFGFPIPK